MYGKLYHLQELETAERAIETERRSSSEYQSLGQIKKSFEAKKQQYLRLVAAATRIDNSLAQLTEQCCELEQRVEQEKNAVYDGSITNAKELAAREAQAEALQIKLNALEDKKAAAMTEVELQRKAADNLYNELEQQQQSFAAVKEAYQTAQDGREQRLQALADQKKTLLTTIDKTDLAWFRAEGEKFFGTPIARLDKKQVCSGCHTIVPPIVYKRTVAGQKTYCEKCGRLLFVDNID